MVVTLKVTGTIAVCVERNNAIWYLTHELQQFTTSSPSYSKALYCKSTQEYNPFI